MTKQYNIRLDHDNRICGEYSSSIGNASALKSAKSIIRNCRKDSGIFVNPHNFRVYDTWSDEEYAPIVYQED